MHSTDILFVLLKEWKAVVYKGLYILEQSALKNIFYYLFFLMVMKNSEGPFIQAMVDAIFCRARARNKNCKRKVAALLSPRYRRSRGFECVGNLCDESCLN